MVKVEKATAKGVHKAKRLAKLATVIELGSAEKLLKTPMDEREKTYGPLNLKSGERRSST